MKLTEFFEQGDSKSQAESLYDRWLSSSEGDAAISEVRDIYPDYQDGQLDAAADWLMDKLEEFAGSHGIDFDTIESDVFDLVINGLT